MANKKNVEANKKNTEIKNKKSNELEQKKPTKKKKRRLHSHLKVNIPLFQSLMMILPSLTKHAAAEDIDSSGDTEEQLPTNSVTEKDVSDHHGKTDSSAVTHPEAQTNDSDVNSTLSASHAPHGSSSHLVPSHHLSTLSHPQVHYIPSVSMPTISSGSNGQPTHSNVPTTPALPVTFMPEVIKGTYGELHVDANGQYTFVLNPKSPQYILLNQHQQGTDHFLLHLSNGSSVIVQVPVTGKQDTPSISGDLTGVVTEDHNIDSQGLLHANGKIDVIDPDQSESSVTPEVISGKYGSLTIDADGHWQYQVDNSLSNVQALTAATSLHESFTIHTKDGTPQTIDMTIGGNDDNAVITGVDAGTLTEDLTTQVQGQLSVTDSDLGEDHFQASQVTSNFGTLSITKDGAWTYALDNNNPVVQGLAQGSTTTDIVTVHSADGTTHKVTITVNGTNDKAIIGGTSSGSVTEESQLQTSGTLTVTDVDTGEAHFSNTDIVGNLGTLHLTDSGTWTYDLDNTNPTVQALGAHKTATDTITVHSAGGTPHQVTITVNGTNDKAVIGGTSSGAVTEESKLQTSGSLTVTDVDTGEAHFSNTDIVGNLGTLHLTDSGAWTYDLDNTNPTVQALGAHKTATDTITVHSADGTPHQVTITVNGTNDAAVIMGTSTGDVHEGHTFTAPDGSMTGGYVDDRSPDHQHGNIGKLWNDEIHTDGHLSVVDADAGESYAQTGTYYGTHGRVILQTNGDWTYYASIGQDATGRAIDHLGKGESLTDTVTVKSADGTTHDIVVTIHGDNDRPYCSSEVQLNSGKEDLAQTITATELLANTIDVDTNDIGKLTIANLHADHGSIQDNQDGTFTFTPTKDYNGQVHFTYDVTDAHGGITATGANLQLQATGDAATITGIDQGNVTEDRGYIDTQYNLHFDGKLDIVDPDQGEAQFDIQRGHTYHGIGYDTKMGGWVLLQQDGTYTYTIDNRKPEIQNLGSTETLVDKVTIHSVDGTSHEIQITIHGTNDDPKVSSVTTLPAGTEDTDVVLHASDLLANATDIDHNDAGQLSVANLTADHGKITDNHDGTFTFHPALDYNGKVSFTYDVKDAHAGSTATSASMTLAPTSDAAVITGSGSGVKEDINVDISGGYLLGASGVFHVVDPDGPAQSQFPDVLYGGIYQGSHGGDLQVNSNGNYYYHISNYLVQHLSEGETLKEEYTIHSVDGTQHKVEFTVEGTNDKPVLSAQSQSVTEGGTLLSGQMHATDVDTKDTHTFTIDKPVDGLTFNNDGSYTFDPSHASYQNLGANNDQVIHVQVKVDDHNGGTDTKELTLVVHGTNDKAVISGDTHLSSSENHILPHGTDTSFSPVSLHGQMTSTDVDSGEANLFQKESIQGANGYLHMEKDGSYRYDPAPSQRDVINSLTAHESFTETFTIHSIDGTPQQVQVTINGSNDSAQILDINVAHVGNMSHGGLSEDNQNQIVGSLLKTVGYVNVVDPDHGEDVLQSETVTTTSGGVFKITGHDWTYEINKDSSVVQNLGANEQIVERHTITSIDGTASHKITVTIHGTNDDPQVSSTVTLASGTEDTDVVLHASDLLANATDIDHNDAGQLSVANLTADHGNITDNHDGTFTFHPTQDYNGKVSFTYDVQDTHGGSVATSASITLTPTRDSAVISGNDAGTIIEDHNVGHSSAQKIAISGSLSVTDPDTGEDHFRFNQFGEKAIHDPFGGDLRITPAGSWGYEVSNSRLQSLAEGEVEKVVYRVYSADHTAHDITITVTGTNDQPTIIATTLAHGTEDTHYQMQASQFGFSDIDSGDTLHSIAITDLPPATQGKFLLDGHDVTARQQISTADISKLQFVPAQDFNGDVQFKFTVNDGHENSLEATNTLHIDPVADAATIAGVDTGGVTEDSFYGMQWLITKGQLTISDADTGEDKFDSMLHAQNNAGIGYDTKLGGHVLLSKDGSWQYNMDNFSPAVQKLAEGETAIDTVTIHSVDGTSHEIQVTITGTNDAPILGVNQTSSTTGTLTETDVDVKDTHTFSVVSSTGQFGSLSVNPNTGDYVYTPNTSITGMSYNSATNTYHGVDVFEVKVSDQHAESSKFITFDASGHVTTSPTGGLVISTTVPQQPSVTATQPTLPSGTNIAPTNTVTLDLASTSDSGSSSTDNLTNDTTPTITGHTDIPFSKVTIYDGSTPVGHAVSDASGQYSVAVSSLSNGDHNLSAEALAPSSVMSATSSPLSVHIDTQVHVGIQTDPITADHVINAQESNSSIDITGSVSGDFNTGNIVTLDVNGTQHTGVVDAKGHYSIAVPGSELIADADQKIEASIAVTDTAGNSAHATADVTYQVDTQVSVPTITFENAGSDNLYSKAEIARGHANTITATVTPPGDAKIGEHLVVNGQDHVLDAHTLQHGIQIEVHPGSNVQATMTDEHGNTAGSQGFAASAIPEPIIVRPPSGSHQVSGTLGVPPLLPSLTPVPTAQSGWRIHLPNGQYVTSHHGQYGTLTIDPQTGHLHYQEQAQVHTGPHGSASGIGQHEDKFEVALQGTNQDEVVAHVNIQILSHGPGHSGKLTVGTEVVDMTITPLVHTSHPAPPPPPPVQHDEPDMASQADFTVTLSDDSNLDLTQQTHQEPDQKTSHHGAAAYLDALGIKPDATSTTVHDQPADMDIVLAQVDQPDAVTHDQAHLDMSDALEHHDANINHNQDDEHHHHNDVDGLPDIDPNS
ncbi:VCBS domain-containing protein [Vibrio coralliirubri]|uniref:VCBS domain-containing protein n=3 Tax=Vibrio coralliirubri TaxID=1516159 RepID=UPI0021C36100|nr:VCBS domain-containing protein [Vibrio coralliirubri]